MPNNRDVLERLLTEADIRRTIIEEKTKVSLFQTFAALVLVGIIIGVGILLTSGQVFMNEDQQTASIIKLQKSQEKLQNNINSLTSSLVQSKNADIVLLSQKIDLQNQQLSNLSASVTVDPDKALTATFLRQKEVELSSQVSDLRESNQQLSSKMDTVIITLIAAPIITLALALIGNIFVGPWLSQKSAKGGRTS